jgi:tryptophan-rich sensory protein
VTEQRTFKPLLYSAALALGIALAGGTLTDIGPWYQSLRKPAWQPPDWLFAPAWTIILALTALSVATAWRNAPDRQARNWLMGLFVLNGILNVSWSFLFFRLKRPDLALIETGFLWLSVLFMMIAAARWSRAASLMLVPYLAWVAFAAWLNLAIVRLN